MSKEDDDLDALYQMIPSLAQTVVVVYVFDSGPQVLTRVEQSGSQDCGYAMAAACGYVDWLATSSFPDFDDEKRDKVKAKLREASALIRGEDLTPTDDIKEIKL